MKLSKVDKAFYLVVFVSFCLLIFTASTLSIGYKEALIYFNNRGIVGFLSNISCDIFGSSNVAFRFPFILISILNLFLMHYISRDYFRYEKDRIYNLAVFAFLPGVLSASLLANEAIIVIFITLAYVAWHKKFNTHNYILLVIALFVDNSFVVLFLALSIYGIFEKDKMLVVVGITLLCLSLYLFGFDGGGKPKGYLIETIAIFATIFSPLLFLYFFYSMYTVPLRNEKNLLWYISFSALVVALILSLRQKIAVEDFAPFVVVAIPFMMKLFLNSMRVRLPQFREKYYIGSYFVLGILFLNSFIILYNKPFYLFVKDASNHFAFEYSFAADIAEALKEQKIKSIIADDYKMQKQLEFYGITKGGDCQLQTNIKKISNANIKFTYLGKTIFGVNVTKRANN